MCPITAMPTKLNAAYKCALQLLQISMNFELRLETASCLQDACKMLHQFYEHSATMARIPHAVFCVTSSPAAMSSDQQTVAEFSWTGDPVADDVTPRLITPVFVSLHSSRLRR